MKKIYSFKKILVLILVATVNVFGDDINFTYSSSDSLTEYFPLAIGNKYQYMCRRHDGGPPSTWFVNFEISRDTIINGERYYEAKLDKLSKDWARIDTLGKLHYINFNNEDKILMDFSLPNDTIFNGLLIHKSDSNIYGINTEIVQHGNYKKYSYKLGYIYNYWTEQVFSDLRKESESLVQFIRKNGDSLILYQQAYVPTFEIHELNFENFKITGFIGINHYYSIFYTGFIQEDSFNFISSASLEGFYQKGDSIISSQLNELFNVPYSAIYSLDYSLDSLLMKNGFEFHYRFKTKDKSLIPQYSFYPDTGYFNLNYEPNSVDKITFFNQNFLLFQNYPNPFNPTTIIKYSIPSSGNGRSLIVKLKIYDVLGKEIATLVNEEQPVGNYSVKFDATNTLPSGVYFYQLRAGKFVETKKFILTK